jgi:hypothetical protein
MESCANTQKRWRSTRTNHENVKWPDQPINRWAASTQTSVRAVRQFFIIYSI